MDENGLEWMEHGIIYYFNIWKVICENQANFGKELGCGLKEKKSIIRAFATRAKNTY